MRLARGGPLVVLVAGLAIAGCSSSSGPDIAPATPSVGTASTAASASSGVLPMIPEAFTLLPCPSHTPASTIEIEGCAEHQIVRLDKQVMSAARSARAALPTAAGRRDLAAAQYAWISYRRAACTSESDVYSGGTLAPVAYANCEVRIDKVRLADLKAMSGP